MTAIVHIANAEVAINSLVHILTGQDLKGISIPGGVRGGEPSADLSVAKLEAGIPQTEEIMFFYLNNPQNKIILTSSRFLKIEKGKVVSETPLNRIKTVRHIQNGAFSWDKVETTEVCGRVETFGIYKSNAAAFFTQVIQAYLNRLHATTK